MFSYRKFASLLLLGCLLVRAEDVERQRELIESIKETVRELGFEQPGSFATHAPDRQAYYRCYYIGKLTLPDSYEGLRMEYGDANGCKMLDDRKYDVFFYPIEAVATASTPVTSSLAAASLERLAVVVPHENFHEDKDVRKLPEPIGEAAATLVGFLTGAEFARTRFGEDSPEFRNLSREAGLFLQKAELVNSYHARLGRVYAARRAGHVREGDALSTKARLFDELQQACRAISPEPRSFNRCPGAFNNAGLAFDATYTRHYPLLYDLHRSLGENLKATIEAIQQARRLAGRSEEQVVAYFRGLAGKSREAASSGR